MRGGDALTARDEGRGTWNERRLMWAFNAFVCESDVCSSYMKKKTYLSKEEQWDRTVKFVLKSGFDDSRLEDPHENEWFLGQIVLPHRLFVPGDLVVIRLSNGMGQRQPVWAVSSKGRQVQGLYLNYASAWRGYKQGKYYRRGYWDRNAGAMVQRWIRKRCRRTLGKPENQFEHPGPLRFVEVPEHLVGSQPDAPPLRQFIVALAREGWRIPGKRE